MSSTFAIKDGIASWEHDLFSFRSLTTTLCGEVSLKDILSADVVRNTGGDADRIRFHIEDDAPVIEMSSGLSAALFGRWKKVTLYLASLAYRLGFAVGIANISL